MKKKKKNRKKKAYSLPSLRERSETPGVLDRRNWESQETPIAQNRPFGFGPHYWRSGCRRSRQESILYAGAEPATRLLTFRSQSASEWANSTSHQNWVQIWYLNPASGWTSCALRDKVHSADLTKQ